MTVQLVEADALETAKAGHKDLAARMIATTIGIVAGVACKIADEVAFVIREDFRHGRLSRDPKDWER